MKRSQFVILVAALVPSLFTGCDSGGGDAFVIANVEYPDTVVSDGERGDLTIHWTGNPTFPVEASYRPSPGGCPDSQDVTCGMPTQIFSDRESPLIFAGSPFCFGVTEEVVFGFEVELTDANGVATGAYPAPFTCVPQ